MGQAANSCPVRPWRPVSERPELVRLHRHLFTYGEQEPERRSVDDVDDLRLRVAVLEAQLEATEDERDFLRQQVQTLTMAQAVMAQAQAQKALEPEKKPRRWRWPWQREAKS
jgi:hypothetical protein